MGEFGEDGKWKEGRKEGKEEEHLLYLDLGRSNPCQPPLRLQPLSRHARQLRPGKERVQGGQHDSVGSVGVDSSQKATRRGANEAGQSRD